MPREKVDMTVFQGDNGFDTVDAIVKVAKKYANEVAVIQQDNISIIDVSAIMEELNNVSELLMIADKTSQGVQTNVAVKTIMGRYQSFMRECCNGLGYFRLATKDALENHVLAVELLQDEDYKDALDMIGECRSIAIDMSKKGEELETAATELQTKAQDAIETAAAQVVLNNEQRADIEREKRRIAEEQEEYKKLDELYEQEIQRYKEKEEQALDRADKEHSKAWVLDKLNKTLRAVKCIGKPVEIYRWIRDGDEDDTDGKKPDKTEEEKRNEEKIKKLQTEVNNLKRDIEKKKKEIKTAEKNHEEKKVVDGLKKEREDLKDAKERKEKEIRDSEGVLNKVIQQQVANVASADENAKRISAILEKKRDLEIQNKARLAGNAVEFSNNIEDLKDIEIAIEMIKLTEQALGRIKVALINTVRFWEQQAVACELLDQAGKKTEKELNKIIKASESQDEDEIAKIARKLTHAFEKEIRKSGLTWLTLFKINHEGLAGIERGYNSINKVMMEVGKLETRDARLKEAKKVLTKMSITYQQQDVLKAIKQ